MIGLWFNRKRGLRGRAYYRSASIEGVSRLIAKRYNFSSLIYGFFFLHRSLLICLNMTLFIGTCILVSIRINRINSVNQFNVIKPNLSVNEILKSHQIIRQKGVSNIGWKNYNLNVKCSWFFGSGALPLLPRWGATPP